MNNLCNKRILLGVTGGIAAYKSAEIIRQLKSADAEVRVVMTKAACEFITPLTLQALSGNPVHTSLLNPEAEAAMGHIELARWADLILVAPASANFIARLANGQADDLLTTLFLASNSKKVIAPAMNVKMWSNKATVENCESLREKDILLIGPASGSQACGDEGPGRMMEPTLIAEICAKQFTSEKLAGKKVVITAGPTQEAIDPVRYISNHSSGKMGYALAQAALDAGAHVTLISGPVNIAKPDRAHVKSVVSAQEMLDQSLIESSDCDIFIACAAVADFKPLKAEIHKIKKQGDQDCMTLELIKNPDIVATVAKQLPDIFILGFAAETKNLEDYAQKKLKTKNLDMIAANDVSDNSIGFNSEQNSIILFSQDKHAKDNPKVQRVEISLASKANIADQIINTVSQKINKI